MADPRANVKFEGIGRKAQTFKADGSITFDKDQVGGSAQVGQAVKLVGNSQVGAVVATDEILGRLESVDSDGYAVVQTEGYAVFAAAAAIAAGSKVSGAAGGQIQLDAVNGSHTVIDGSDAAAIVVLLDKR